MRARKILETCLYVDDLNVAEGFYSIVLGLQVYAKVPGRHVFFRCGEAMFLLFNAETTKLESTIGVPAHGASGPGHVAFEMDESEIDGWKTRLTSNNVSLEKDYTWPNGGRSLYFRDPAGNSVELTTRRTWGLQSQDSDGAGG